MRRDKTGVELRMKEPYSEGVANHTGPEPWGYVGDDMAQASVGETAGRPSSREIVFIWGADAVRLCRRQHSYARQRESIQTPRGPRNQACRETPRTRTGIPNRPPVDGTTGRFGKPKGVIQR